MLLARARALAVDLPNVAIQEADGRSLPFEAASFDVVILDLTLLHIPGPERVLGEAYRVLRPAGWLGAFDGYYATTTVAVGDRDPPQRCADAMIANPVNDRWLMRRLPALVCTADAEIVIVRSHSYLEAGEGGYLLTVVDGDADLLRATCQIGDDLAGALEDEARRRSAGSFFGHVAYASLIERRPA